MPTLDFFRSHIDAMINLSDPLAVLATRLPWAQIEALLAPKFEHHHRGSTTNNFFTIGLRRNISLAVMLLNTLTI